MFYELNIGLLASNHANDQDGVTRREALIALRAAGFRVRGYRFGESATEPTMIVLAEHTASVTIARRRVHDLAYALRQDAIAFRPLDAVGGFLEGPRAEDWGKFNPEFFLPIGEEYFLQGAP